MNPRGRDERDGDPTATGEKVRPIRPSAEQRNPHLSEIAISPPYNKRWDSRYSGTVAFGQHMNAALTFPPGSKLERTSSLKYGDFKHRTLKVLSEI